MFKNDGIIDADELVQTELLTKKVCYKISVPHQDKIFDCDAIQVERNEIKQHVCEDVVIA